jgi:hypothetical protein
LFKCADRVPRGLWGSLCGAQQKSLLRVLRGYGYCLRRGSAERCARREAELVAREWGYWEDKQRTASTCTEPVRSCMDVVFVVAPSEEVSPDRPLACDAVDSARPVSVPQDPLAGCQTEVHGACTVVLPDVAWQMSCLEYGLEQRVDGRLACVDGAVVRDCPRSLLLGDDAALIAECVDLLFGTCAVTGREHVYAANGIAGVAETACVEDDMAARCDVAHSHARRCNTQHEYVKKDPAHSAGRHRGVHGSCMQDAVLSCCHGDLRRRMRARFATVCRDSGGSGLSGTFTDACNLAAVGVGVLLEGVWLWVVGRAPGVSRSWMRWKLGD